MPFTRPRELAEDNTMDYPVFRHAVDTLRRESGYSLDILVHLRPTCPIRNVETIDRAIELFLKERSHGATSLRAVSIPKDNPFKMWLIEKGRLKPLIKLESVDEPYNSPRQLLPMVYWQNGYIDVTTVETLERFKSMTGPDICAFVVNERIFDIDYRESLESAEQYLRQRDEGAQAEDFEPQYPG